METALVESGGDGRTPWTWLLDPPLWFRLFVAVCFVAPVLAVGSKRGVAVGAVAGVVFGVMAVGVIAGRARTVAWSRCHPAVDRLVAAPLLFVAVAAGTSLPLWACAVIAVGVTAALHVVDRVRSRSRLR